MWTFVSKPGNEIQHWHFYLRFCKGRLFFCWASLDRHKPISDHITTWTSLLWVRKACRAEFGPLGPTEPEFRYFWNFQWHTPINSLLFILPPTLGVSFPLLPNKSPKWYAASSYFSVFFLHDKMCRMAVWLYLRRGLFSAHQQLTTGHGDKWAEDISVESIDRKEPDCQVQCPTHQLPPGWPWATYSASLCLCFLIYTIGTIIVFILWDYCKD